MPPVSRSCGERSRPARPAWPAGARPDLVAGRHGRRPRGCEAHLAPAGQRCHRPGRDPAVRARQPHLVLPVAATPRPGSAGMARGGARPPRDGLVRAAGRPADAGRAGRRPRHPHRRPRRDRPGGHGRTRLGRVDLAGLGARPPAAAARRGAHQHRCRPGGGRQGTGADPARARLAAPRDLLPAHAVVRALRDGPVPARAAPRRASRARRAVHLDRPAGLGARLRRRHPLRRRPPVAAHDRGHRRRRADPRRPRADALGTARPGLRREVPRRPARAHAARPAAPLRGCLPPGHRGCTAVRRGRGAVGG